MGVVFGRALLVMALAGFLAGCAAPASPGNPLGSTGGRALSFDPVEGCATKQAEPLAQVLQTQEEYVAFWQTHCSGVMDGNGNPFPPPTVDLPRGSVVAVFQGEKRTGGFAIQIENITEQANQVLIEVARTSPGATCAVMQQITHPVDVVASERISKAARFTYRDVVEPC